MRKHTVTEQIPRHLQAYIARQDASLYTSMDHASWRFVMKLSRAFFSDQAHQKYLDGLRETGISTERIPLISEMDECLRRFQWRAVAVTGFIPPAIFMEFLSLGVLPIACDMRKLENLSYTPAPDIVHEAAGHAPIIADQSYSEYLRSYGEISRKAIYSIQDMRVYEAIRLLSDTKENPRSTSDQIQKAEEELQSAVASVTEVSEATYLSRMGWWTFEYGLVGDLKSPKIYGAGLLSSVSESYHCFDPEVKKVPFSIDCIYTSFDITRPQPQLFVAPSFEVLKKALEDLADQMAFRRGGVEGLEKAKRAQTLTTTVLETGLQISGILNRIDYTAQKTPCYLQYSGPVQLAYNDQEIEGHGVSTHAHGFGTLLVEPKELESFKEQLTMGKPVSFRFSSGISLEGVYEGEVKRGHTTVILSLSSCTIRIQDRVLFQPEWGTYDMACGFDVHSVFGGPADRESYMHALGEDHPDAGQQKSNLTIETEGLNQLYSKVRGIREGLVQGRVSSDEARSLLEGLYRGFCQDYREDWLLRYELIELSVRFNLKLVSEGAIREELRKICLKSQDLRELIQRGLEVI